MKRILITLGCLISVTLSAQNSKINPVIEVERLYDASLMEVNKPKLNTSVDDSLRRFNTLFNYSIFEKPLHNLYQFSPLPSAVLEPTENADKRYIYLRTGAGYPLAPHGDLLLQLPIHQKWFLALNTHHRSLWQDLQRMNNNALLHIEYRNRKSTFFVKGGFNHLYHSFATDSLASDLMPPASFQRYLRTGGQMGLYSTDTVASSWRYKLIAGYWHGQNQLYASKEDVPWIVRENVLRLNGSAGYNIFTSFSVNLETEALFASNLWEKNGESSSRAILDLYPHILWQGERYKVAAGVRLGYLMHPDGNAFHLYPQLDAHYTLAPEWLSLFGKLKGRAQLNTYQDRIAENPWIYAPQMRDSHTPWDVQAGVCGSISDVFSYRLYAQYRNTRDQFYYVNDYSIGGNPAVFSLNYADETRYSVGASFSFTTERFQAQLSGVFHEYNMDPVLPPWHTPKLEVKANARYNWRERIILTLNAYYRGECEALTTPLWSSATAFNSTLPAFLDLGFNAEFVWTKCSSIYLYGSNLLGRDITYFHLYKDPGALFGAGITLRF